MAEYAPYIGSAAFLQLRKPFGGPQCMPTSYHRFDLGLKAEAAVPSFCDTINVLGRRVFHAKPSKFGESKVSVCPDLARLEQIRDTILSIRRDPRASTGDAALKHQCKPGSEHLKYILAPGDDNIVYELRGGKKAQIRLMIPREMAHLVLVWAHISDTDGKHLGRDATYNKLSKHFSPSSISKDIVSEWIQKCSCHDKTTHKMRAVRTPLTPYPGYTPANIAPATAPQQASAPDAPACIAQNTPPQPTPAPEVAAPIAAVPAPQPASIAANMPSLGTSQGTVPPSPSPPNPQVEDLVMGETQPAEFDFDAIFDGMDGLQDPFEDVEMPSIDDLDMSFWDDMQPDFGPSKWAEDFEFPGTQAQE